MRSCQLVFFILTVAGSSVAFAQGGTLVRVTAGPEQVAQKNPAESPYVYNGSGWTASLAVTRKSASRVRQVEVVAGKTTMRSDLTPSDANHLALDLGYRDLRPFVGGSVLVGASLVGALEGSSHSYPVYRTRDNFGYLRLSVGPVVRLRWRRFTNDFQVPLLSLIDFPYTDAKSNGDGLRFSVAGPAALTAGEEALSMRARNFVLSYRISALRYRYDEPRVFARQSFSLGFERGGSKP
jgi:hypothetical protein